MHLKYDHIREAKLRFIGDLRNFPSLVEDQLREHGVCEMPPVTHEQVQSYVNKILEESQCK